VFELSLTKLPHYVLPTYPAIALLAAKVFTNGYPRLLAMKSRWFLTSMATLWLLAGGTIAAGLAFLPYIIDHEWSVAQAIASILLVFIQGFALVMLAQRHIRSIWLLTCSSLIFIGCSFGLTLPYLEHLWATREIYDLVAVNQACEHTSLLSVGYDEPSLVFVAGTQTLLINDGHTAANALLQNPCSLAIVDHEHQAAFLAGFGGSSKLPTNLGDIDGYNIGHGYMAHLTLYSLPLR
jgi:4-amino-4-deoxy-L-arabinose transferase-like glycosyltransferase